MVAWNHADALITDEAALALVGAPVTERCMADGCQVPPAALTEVGFLCPEHLDLLDLEWGREPPVQLLAVYQGRWVASGGLAPSIDPTEGDASAWRFGGRQGLLTQ